jgi:hypothetical protein
VKVNCGVLKRVEHTHRILKKLSKPEPLPGPTHGIPSHRTEVKELKIWEAVVKVPATMLWGVQGGPQYILKISQMYQ